MPRLSKLVTTTAAAGIIFAALTVSDTASALQLYGSVGNGSGSNRGDIISINQHFTNSYTTIGNPTTSGGITGLAFDNSAPGPSGSLWGSQGFGFNTTSTLIEIDPDDGSLINDVGAIHTDASDVAGSSISIGDLAFNSVDGKLYAITSDAAAPGGPVDGIYTVDTGTGLATLVGKTIWDTTAGIAFDAAGTLYALGFDPHVGPFGTNMLFTFDLDNLIFDGVDPLLLEDNTRVTVDINDYIFSGLGINPLTGEIYASESRTGNIYKVDPNTGAMDFTGMPTGAFVSDVTFRVAEPGTLAVMGLGLMGLAYIRRRRAI
ncbi:MAG: hypothetical protein ACI9JL_002482 [Paracoccaceae bacterium]|jgi:hypothetical protein